MNTKHKHVYYLLHCTTYFTILLTYFSLSTTYLRVQRIQLIQLCTTDTTPDYDYRLMQSDRQICARCRQYKLLHQFKRSSGEPQV